MRMPGGLVPGTEWSQMILQAERDENIIFLPRWKSRTNTSQDEPLREASGLRCEIRRTPCMSSPIYSHVRIYVHSLRFSLPLKLAPEEKCSSYSRFHFVGLVSGPSKARACLFRRRELTFDNQKSSRRLSVPTAPGTRKQTGQDSRMVQLFGEEKSYERVPTKVSGGLLQTKLDAGMEITFVVPRQLSASRAAKYCSWPTFQRVCWLPWCRSTAQALPVRRRPRTG
ncbi:hypothetical protein V8F20_012665 [Naviculisporaceae sp. PSN 640]